MVLFYQCLVSNQQCQGAARASCFLTDSDPRVITWPAGQGLTSQSPIPLPPNQARWSGSQSTDQGQGSGEDNQGQTQDSVHDHRADPRADWEVHGSGSGLTESMTRRGHDCDRAGDQHNYRIIQTKTEGPTLRAHCPMGMGVQVEVPGKVDQGH